MVLLVGLKHQSTKRGNIDVWHRSLCGNRGPEPWMKFSHLVVDFPLRWRQAENVIPRHVATRLRKALSDRPVVLLQGARQSGKTTLARTLAENDYPAHYVTLDGLTALAAARSDPEGFLAGLEGPVVIDEVQRAPELFLATKAEVDRARRPGRFLLTGSANVLLPTLAEMLVGRMEVVTLWPFSQGEMDGTCDSFVDAVFDDGPPAPERLGAATPLLERLLRGGYPEATIADSPARRGAWFDRYLATLLARDVRDLARIEGLADLPRLLALIAARPMSVLNLAELARTSRLRDTTLKRYFALLEAVFLVRTIPPWHGNLGKRLVKTPKVLLTDSGLAAHLMGLDATRLERDRSLLGGLLEGFVAMEIVKQLGWSQAAPALLHFRTHAGHEVDLVLERRSGEVVGIEVKSAASVTAADLQGLRALETATGPRFHRGVVLYTGREVIPFGPRLHAVPLEALWSCSSRVDRGRTA